MKSSRSGFILNSRCLPQCQLVQSDTETTWWNFVGLGLIVWFVQRQGFMDELSFGFLVEIMVKIFISPNFPPASHIGLWGGGRWVGGSVGGIFGAWSYHKLYILNLLIQQGRERGNSTNPTIVFNVTILLAGIIIICLGMQLGGTKWVFDGKNIPYNGGSIITVVSGRHWKGLLRTRGRWRLCGWIWGWKLDWELIQGNMGWHLRCVRWLR